MLLANIAVCSGFCASYNNSAIKRMYSPPLLCPDSLAPVVKSENCTGAESTGRKLATLEVGKSS